MPCTLVPWSITPAGRSGQPRSRQRWPLRSPASRGFPFWLGCTTILRGGALAAQGQGEAGLRQIHQGLDTIRATGTKAACIALALLARAYGKVGQAEAGLSVLAEALELVHRTGERVNETELYWLRGELTLQQFNVQGSKFKVQEEAEACFHKAIEIARRQSAKSWELRAVMSLSQLWQQQGKKEAARQMLAEIYGWFTEGFDTADLREARALIEELA